MVILTGAMPMATKMPISPNMVTVAMHVHHDWGQTMDPCAAACMNGDPEEGDADCDEDADIPEDGDAVLVMLMLMMRC